ncbi:MULTISPECIES: 3-hydroxyacyl-CoA dehydrogenase family protein [Rhodocyclales]|uniref:Uncharacterized protein n=1 Tax=Aromatoleum buckelii TaxID=200254 RepID=A0ABX1N359_9RHOO|nr:MULTISPECIES: 3-hydroxyacyl-CoA dehydrogenase family protein [Rhodocyclales]MCK0513162.1 3-hydroxyacyl-CoA dehydrogenase family protein [Aromatoleum buckelii]
MRFSCPASVIELVEVVFHSTVSDAVERVVEFCNAIGKAPVILRKEILGFIVNRIFRAPIRESVTLYEDAYASAEDVDLDVVKRLGCPICAQDTTEIDVFYLARTDEYNETGLASAKPNRIGKEMYAGQLGQEGW